MGVLGDTYLPAVEIIPRGAYFDYFCKYQKDGAQEICPAPITQEQWRTVGETGPDACTGPWAWVSIPGRTSFWMRRGTSGAWRSTPCRA